MITSFETAFLRENRPPREGYIFKWCGRCNAYREVFVEATRCPTCSNLFPEYPSWENDEEI